MSFQEQVKVKVNTSSPDGYHSKPSIAENLVHSGCNTSSPDGYHSKPSIAENLVHSGCIFMDSRLQSLS